ncbi:flagellar hook-associated protein FlgK [Bradyrhizobium sp. SRS-191]|uniref:flagellar hook-associated protein FlgK n=1 Tax=Bradyrhizobium sp. SRS-191 TaxID=2962606 RepID=UPI00211F1DBB|nr:flagellar hook-associated protein FlgK [Bradyrhizobium sp. SRS-191]
MLTNAFNTATAGLQTLQLAIGTVSQNVANSGSAGYTRRAVSTESAGPGNSGVAVARIDRTFDEVALKQMRLESSHAAYASTKAEMLAQIDKLNGRPADSSALDARMNVLAKSLQALASNSASASSRSTVMDAASVLADKIRGMADTLNGLREGSNKRVAAEVSAADGLLTSIAALNVKATTISDASTRAGILDRRDQQINELARYIEVKTISQSDGSVTLMTNSGLTLVERGAATRLSFNDRAPAAGGGTVVATLPGGAGIDLDAAALSSGSISANLEIRDAILPRAQRRLDDLAFGLAQAFTNTTVTAGRRGAGFELRLDDLAKMQPGNTITISVGSGDTARSIVLVASNLASKSLDAEPSGRVQTFAIPTLPATSQAYAAALSTALTAAASGLSVTSGGSGTIKIDGPDIQGVAASVTQPKNAGDLSGGYPKLAVFVDGAANALVTGSMDDGSQRLGLAARLAVNTALKADTSALVAAGSSASTLSRPQVLYDALASDKQSLPSPSGSSRSPFWTTVMSFARDMVASAGSEAAAAAAVSDQQSVAKANAEAWFSKGAGVNIDEEMSRLIALQTAYAANARVLTAAREMIDLLLRA